MLPKDRKLFAEVIFCSVGNIVGAWHKAIIGPARLVEFAIFANVQVC